MSRPATPSRPRLPRFGAALRLAVSAAVLAVVASVIDVGAALSRLATADAGWLVAAGLALTLQTVLSAVRWRLTADRLGQRIPLRRAVSEYYVAQLVNQTLPGGVLGDVGRAVRARHQGGVLRAGQAVALERLAGQIALLAVALAAVVATALVPGGVAWPEGTAVVAGGAAALTLMGLAVLRRLPRRYVPAAVAVLAADGWHALAAPGVRGAQITLNLGTVACNVAAFAFCAWATGTDLSAAAALALVPVVLLAMLIPVGVAGWGFREGAASALWPLADATAAAGVAASVAFGATLLVASLPGLVPLLTGAARGAGRRT